ncbi:MAG: MATE family efflux transporter [Clostridiales bacterium]|nr:MATE family efflux transporter [Clostridiales bacterium]
MEKERIHLSEHFGYRKLLKFVLPSVVMMVFVSIYGIVDGLFVSNFVGGTPFAALNLIFPLIMILGAIGFMLGVGGNAVVSKLLGERKDEKANEIFSMLVYTTAVLGAVLAVVGILIARPVAEMFAKNEKNMSALERAELVEYCVMYARTILCVLPMFMLQNAFQGFFVTAEKPRLGLLVTVLAGCTNIVLDALLVAVFRWGLFGAAIATAISQAVGGIVPVLYFVRKNDSLLKLGKTKMEWRTLGAVCVNGSSELITNISLSVVTMLYNAQLMRLEGITGVSAYGIMQYIGFIFVAVFLGYAVGCAPITGYHYGAKNHVELKNIFKKSLILTALVGTLMTGFAIAMAWPFSWIFANSDKGLLTLTTHGMRIYSVCYLACGVNIFASAFFTALGNGGVSLLISFFRTFLCQVLAVLILPIFWGTNGVWVSFAVAEGITIILSALLFMGLRKRYHYA